MRSQALRNAIQLRLWVHRAWRNIRPCAFTHEEHLANPEVNTTKAEQEPTVQPASSKAVAAPSAEPTAQPDHRHWQIETINGAQVKVLKSARLHMILVG